MPVNRIVGKAVIGHVDLPYAGPLTACPHLAGFPCGKSTARCVPAQWYGFLSSSSQAIRSANCSHVIFLRFEKSPGREGVPEQRRYGEWDQHLGLIRSVHVRCNVVPAQLLQEFRKDF